MKNMRSFYSSNIEDFKRKTLGEISNEIHRNSVLADIIIQQKNAWDEEITILKEQLNNLTNCRILFEYTIPRMGKRVDVVLLYKNIVFILEFKCGDKEYRKSTYNQVYDYAQDLRNFHKESHDKLIVPIMVSTKADNISEKIIDIERIVEPVKCNANNIAEKISLIVSKYNEENFDYTKWENSEYLPTPTIIEAAQALYKGHKVEDITRNHAGAKNLSVTTEAINRIIDYSKKNKRKSICFITGVPGAGKTLVGLNIAIQRTNNQQGEHAVFLSGNYPLVTVLKEALAKDKVNQEKELGNRISKANAISKINSFIQIIHRYRDSLVGNQDIPPEKIVIFDEAQRAWTREYLIYKNKNKNNNIDSKFIYSEPGFLISTMDRHKDWAVVICLVGGGQEINTGEAGLPEWFDSLKKSFSDWDVYITPELKDEEYRRNRDWKEMISGLNINENKDLHLSTSVRTFRASELSSFVKYLLDIDIKNAKTCYKKIKEKYPIYVTRNLKTAKEWVKKKAKGTTRYGLIASSGGLRLKPEGIFVKNKIDVAKWFLNDKDDIRSSYSLEDVATEFDIQGLELDYTIVAWDADFRFNNNKWQYHNFSGSEWQNVNQNEQRLYLKNAYRVLLTRARQGMIIYIPEGDKEDQTRKPEYYDGIYKYLTDLGINEIE